MSRAVSISQAREQLSAVLRWTRENSDDVIIENRGRAEAVIIPVKDYELLQAARERKRRREIMDQLNTLAEEVRAQNDGISEAEAEAIADEITRGAIQNLVDKGKVRFED